MFDTLRNYLANTSEDSQNLVPLEIRVCQTNYNCVYLRFLVLEARGTTTM